jgi:WD40 repeat protein
MQSTLKSSIFQPFKPILLVLFTTWLSGCGLAETESTGQTDQSVGGALAADINAKANLSVVSSINNGISVWSLQQNRQKFNFRHAGEGDNLVTNLDISYDGLYLLSADQEAFGLWDLSPNGNYALTGGNDYVAYLWDTRTGQIVYTFRHTSRVSTVLLDEYGRYASTAGKFSQDSKYLLTGSSSRSLDLWDVVSGERVKQYKVGIRPEATMPTAMVYGVDYLDEQQMISLSSSGYAEVWNLPTP